MMLELVFGQLVYVDSSPLTSLHADSKAGKYNKLLKTAYNPFRILQVAKYSLMVDETGIFNVNSTDLTTTVVGCIKHEWCLNASKTFSE